MSVAGSSGSCGAAAITASAHASIATCWFAAGGGEAGVSATGSSDHVNPWTALSETITPSSSTSTMLTRWSAWIQRGAASKG